MISILIYLRQRFISGLAASPLPSGLSYLSSHARHFYHGSLPFFRHGCIGCCGSKPFKELLHVSSVGAEKDFFSMTTLDVP